MSALLSKHLQMLIPIVCLLSVSRLTSSEAEADENLAQKRLTCQMEARHQLKGRGKSGVKTYTIRVEHRQAHVRKCMERPMEEPTATGTVQPK
jgi:hypothetical protein